MGNRYTKRNSTSPTIREMSSKTTTRYHLKPVRMADIKNQEPDFPGGTEVKNPLANAGDPGSIPGLGRFYMPRRNEAHEPQLQKPTCPSPCSATREATMMRCSSTAMKSSPRALQLEKAHTQQWRPNAAKNKIKESKKEKARAQCWWGRGERASVHCWWESKLGQSHGKQHGGSLKN